MSLLKKSQENVKSSGTTEDIDCLITSISSVSDDRKVKLSTDKGVFFPFKNQFPNGKVPYVGKGIKAVITLIEKTTDDGTFVNVNAINYDLEAMSAKQLVATAGLAVALS